MPCRLVPRPAGEQHQSVAQASEHRLRREEVDARRGELDGEREAVQARADLLHRGPVVRRDGEAREHRRSAVAEQRDGILGDHRLDREDVLDREVHRLPAGEQHSHAGRGGHEFRQLRCSCRDALDVIDDEQELAAREIPGERLSCPLADAQGLGDRRQDERWLG